MADEGSFFFFLLELADKVGRGAKETVGSTGSGAPKVLLQGISVLRPIYGSVRYLQRERGDIRHLEPFGSKPALRLPDS
jgi:hypothetical protein